MTESLINYDRMWRTMVCLNPKHDIVKFRTNEIGNIHCPTCKSIMVVELKFNNVIIEELSIEDFE